MSQNDEKLNLFDDQRKNPVVDYTITPVRTADDLEAVRCLFREYAASLNLDLSFQSFEDELATMPGRYAPRYRGEVLLARRHGQPIGCVALRCLSASSSVGAAVVDDDDDDDKSQRTFDPARPGAMIGEVKRLYTVPEARGMGLGRELACRIVDVARQYDYDEIKLDTLPSMTGAQKLYESIGFVDVEPYCFNPVAGTRFLGLKLSR